MGVKSISTHFVPTTLAASKKIQDGGIEGRRLWSSLDECAKTIHDRLAFRAVAASQIAVPFKQQTVPLG